MWVATNPPPATRPLPCTIRSSPTISTSTPLTRSMSAVAARRSDSFTRSSFRPRMRGLKELRVKESDRLAATADMLRVNGVDVEIVGDDLIVHGNGRVAGGGLVATHMDHR